MPRPVHSPVPQPIFGEPVFNEGTVTPDPTTFTTTHPSDNAQYAAIQDLLDKDTVSFDASRVADKVLFSFSDALGPHGPDMTQAIQSAGEIIFHAAGDTGSSSTRNYSSELKVSDAVTADYHGSDPSSRPSFFFHLGDVVYNFGESKYYYDQFYEPYRNYPAPIFAIPGNHDSFIIPGTAADEIPLTTFTRNFCATAPAVTAEAGSLHRTAMTQPGVYFTLDAPFVRIIGLFSNALEDPGLISSENGKWTDVPDIQLAYLTAQLQLIKSENYQGAVILATHHPAFTYSPAPGAGGAGGNHGGSPAMLSQIDSICQAQGVYPHVFLSGHAHNYQRFTRSLPWNGQLYQVPFIISGSGGHAVNPLVQAAKGQKAQEPAQGTDVSYLESNPAIPVTSLTLANYNDKNYGYLKITASASEIKLDFFDITKGTVGNAASDSATVNLSAHSIA